jgi:hypothetical protein
LKNVKNKIKITFGLTAFVLLTACSKEYTDINYNDIIKEKVMADKYSIGSMIDPNDSHYKLSNKFKKFDMYVVKINDSKINEDFAELHVANNKVIGMNIHHHSNTYESCVNNIEFLKEPQFKKITKVEELYNYQKIIYDSKNRYLIYANCLKVGQSHFVTVMSVDDIVGKNGTVADAIKYIGSNFND